MPALPKSPQRAAAMRAPDTLRAPVRLRAPAALRLPLRLLAPFARHPVESTACAVFAALMSGILLNALALQNARHPSPLFGTPIIVAAPAEAPKPAPRPAATVAAPREREAEAPKPADAIGDMLRTAAPNSPAVAAAKPSAIEGARILLVQKALLKLGYVVRPDGVMGATTRQAIEKFERERGWQPHGELTAKVLREISLKSGLPLE